MLRQILEIFIFMSRHVLVASAAVFLLFAAVDPFLNLNKHFRKLCRNHGWLLIAVPAFLFVALFVGMGIWYVNLQGYAGEVEPMISSVSWMVNHGQPLYHEINSPARYSVLYGPSVYLTNGLFLQIFEPTLAISKLPSMLAALLSIVFLYSSIVRKKKDLIAVLTVLMAILLYFYQGLSVYLVRPDALLVFALSFALFGLRRTSGWLSALALGVAVGYAINLKIHSGLYFLPVFVLFQRQNGWRSLGSSLFIAVVLILSPFLLHPQISGINYILWLQNAVGHGLGLETLRETSGFGALLLLPLIFVLGMKGNIRKVLAEDFILYASIMVALVGSLILSAKPGAGLVHLLPLVPVLGFVTASKARNLDHSHWGDLNSSSRKLSVARTAGAALFVVLILSGSVNAYRSSNFVAWENRNAMELTADIESIIADYSDLNISMACGGEGQYFRNTWMRPLLVFADNPVLIDPIAVMDCSKAGVELSNNTFKALKTGEVGMWLVPRNQKPFQKTNWYTPHELIFPESFLDYFAEHYSRQAHTKFFDLWFWNGLDASSVLDRSLAGGGFGAGDSDGKMDK